MLKINNSLFKSIKINKSVSVLPEVWIFVQDIVCYVCQPYFSTYAFSMWLRNTPESAFKLCAKRPGRRCCMKSLWGRGLWHINMRTWASRGYIQNCHFSFTPHSSATLAGPYNNTCQLHSIKVCKNDRLERIS